MFSEYLHHQLVLFGNFCNQNINIQHPYHIKDNEIIVNQIIDRGHSAAGLSQLVKMINKVKKREEQEYYGLNDQGQQQQYNQPKWQLRKQQEEDDEQQYQDLPDYEGYFQNDPNPYGDQFYGMTMDAQYMPEQLNNLGGPIEKEIKKYRNMPLVNIKPKTEEKVGKTIVDQVVNHEQDNQSWITEQEQEYYVNQQLEEVSGGFAADIATD